jgi:hypothetical protein
MSILLVICFIFFFGMWAISSIDALRRARRDGLIKGRYGAIYDRANHPLNFWYHVGLCFVGLIVSIPAVAVFIWALLPP